MTATGVKFNPALRDIAFEATAHGYTATIHPNAQRTAHYVRLTGRQLPRACYIYTIKMWERFKEQHGLV